ncbi:MAG: M28 family peptidase, partial [Myxococcales bacterium]|nr:M28 family peptidase [Myxococcales bacterium]
MRGPVLRSCALLLGLSGALGCREPTTVVASEPGPEVSDGGAEVSAPAVPGVDSISDDPVVRTIVTVAEADSQVEAHARKLAVDIGPRLTGSGALITAERWAEESLGSWGLEARRERWGEVAVGFERGPARGSQIRPQRRELEFSTEAWSPGTRDMVRAQAVVWPGDDAELRARKPYLRNAWVLVPWGTNMRDATGKRMAAAVDKAGVAGLIFAAGAPDDQLIVTQGEPWEDFKHLPTRVVLHLRGDQHAELVTAAEAGELVQLEFSVDNHFIEGPLPQHNVIADLVGDEHPEQVVIIGGHLDSWDGASGAVDNATGVATSLEAARLIAAACERTGRRPRRTLSVQLWSGEEQGLLG